MCHPLFRWCFGASLALVIALGAPALFAQPVKKDCQCRAPDGAMRDLGTVQCVDIAGNTKLVYCTMSTNTPYWKDVPGIDGCPAA